MLPGYHCKNVFYQLMCHCDSGSKGGGELTRPIPGDGGAINSGESQELGKPQGTRPEVQNGGGAAENGQMYRVKCIAV